MSVPRLQAAQVTAVLPELGLAPGCAGETVWVEKDAADIPTNGKDCARRGDQAAAGSNRPDHMIELLMGRSNCLNQKGRSYMPPFAAECIMRSSAVMAGLPAAPSG